MITLRIAVRALTKNKLRACLTVLGIVIGIAAVTAMVSIGESASRLVQTQFHSMGTNLIMVYPQARESGGVTQSRGEAQSLSADDAVAISSECHAVLAASPLVWAGGQAIYGNSNWNPDQMLGVGPEYLTVGNWLLRSGGFFTDRDIASAAKVCVIGHTVVAKLFQTTNPIGEQIRVRNVPLRVIGVLEAKGTNIVGDDQDDVILMPYSTVRKRLQGSSFKSVNAIMASGRSVNLMTEAEHEIRQLLYERHRISPGEQADFEIRNSTEIARMLRTITRSLTLMLASIAGLSLLVGGVGIMNIMLVSVTERTREIGIRMAVGARGRDILLQFLVEAALLASVGGVIGFCLGVSVSAGITVLINSLSEGSEWPMVVSIPAAITAVCFAAVVGLFFGYYPARRASRLDPIDALRYE